MRDPVTVRRAVKTAGLVTLLAGGLVLVDQNVPHQPAHRAEWLSAGDVTVRALRTGQGDTTLVFLHGYGESLMTWRGLLDRLARHHRSVALDLPGFGLSDRPAQGHDLPAMAARVSAFLDEWTRGPVVLVGHSMGGALAAALALDRPDRVVGLVLIAPAGYALGAVVDSLRIGLPEVIDWVNLAAGYIQPVRDPSWLEEPPGPGDDRSPRDSGGRAAAARVLRDFDFGALRHRFAEIRQPVLLVWGERDPTVPLAVGRRIAADLPCERLFTLPHRLHRPHQTDPGRVAAEIEQFLRSPPTCPAPNDRSPITDD